MNNCSAVPSVCTPQHVWVLSTGGCPFSSISGLSWWSLTKPFSLTWFSPHLWPWLLCWLGDPSSPHRGTHSALLVGAVPARSHLSLVLPLWWSFSLVAESTDSTMDRMWPRDRIKVPLSVDFIDLLCRPLRLFNSCVGAYTLENIFWEKNLCGNISTFPSNSFMGSMLHKCHFHSCCCPGRLWYFSQSLLISWAFNQLCAKRPMNTLRLLNLQCDNVGC